MAFCEPATIDEIKSRGYMLTPGRYVGAEEMENNGVPFEKKMAISNTCANSLNPGRIMQLCKRCLHKSPGIIICGVLFPAPGTI